MHMLMDRIFPPDIEAHMVRNSELVVAPSNNEIGYYSAVLADTENKKELMNRELALLMRTKQSGVDEGGVNSGYSVIDSPLVVEHDGDLRQLKRVLKQVN